MGGEVGLLAIVGGLLLAAVLAWAAWRNRARSGRDRHRTEAATHDLYREIDRQDQASDPDPKRF